MSEFSDYYNQAFLAAEDKNGSIYEPMNCLTKAAHETRMELLDKLPLGDLRDKVVVDFGTGSWGFACIFPRLHECKLAIGIDISEKAVALSSDVSKKGNYSYGNRYRYYVSDGLSIPLESKTVDIFFAGESIEHIDNTDVFLDEVCRVLKLEGILILTTPNPNPRFYRAVGLQYAIGPEHTALMGYEEISSYLQPRFNILSWQGFNSSIHPDLDSHVTDLAFAKSWASLAENRPFDACGFVIMARARPNYNTVRYSRKEHRFGNTEVTSNGIWVEMPLHQGLSAWMGKNEAELSINFDADQIVLLMWMHDWSGIANITINNNEHLVDLYSKFGGFKRLVFKNLKQYGNQTLTIKATGSKNTLSSDDQVFFFCAASYSPC